MFKYELMFIVKPDLEEANIKKVGEDMKALVEANEAKVPVKNYLTDERFTDPSLYINSFFFNTKGRKKFTKQFLEDLRAQSIL